LAGTARRNVRSQVRRILEHFLKLRFSPATNPRRKWESSVIDARSELSDDLTRTLHNELVRDLDQLYAQARKLAIKGLTRYAEAEAARLLPETCPWTVDDILRDDWYPPPAIP
jgi:hypothetical protein